MEGYFIESMEKWSRHKLKELITIKHGYAFKGEYFTDVKTNNILLTPGNFAIGGGFQINKPKYYEGPIPEDYVLKKGDLIVTMTDLSKQGDTLGFPAIIPYNSHLKFLHNQRIGLVEELIDEIDLKFLFYSMCTNTYQKFVVGSASGSTVKHTSPGRIREYEISIPSKGTQLKIASILSAYDDLIENNEKRIKLLEEMAQLLFTEWFVKFNFPGHEKIKMVDSGTEFGMIPEGWNLKALENVCDYIGRGISPSYNDEGESIVLNQKCIRNQQISFAESRRQDKKVSTEKIVKFGDVLVCSTGVGTLGRVAQIYDFYSGSTADSHVSIVRPNNNINVDYFGISLLNKEKYFTDQGVGSTGQTELSRSIIQKTIILCPPMEIQLQFSNKVANGRRVLINLRKANDDLAQIRDLLIPQLVTGKRGVKN